MLQLSHSQLVLRRNFMAVDATHAQLQQLKNDASELEMEKQKLTSTEHVHNTARQYLNMVNITPAATQYAVLAPSEN